MHGSTAARQRVLVVSCACAPGQRTQAAWWCWSRKDRPLAQALSIVQDVVGSSTIWSSMSESVCRPMHRMVQFLLLSLVSWDSCYPSHSTHVRANSEKQLLVDRQFDAEMIMNACSARESLLLRSRGSMGVHCLTALSPVAFSSLASPHWGLSCSDWPSISSPLFHAWWWGDILNLFCGLRTFNITTSFSNLSFVVRGNVGDRHSCRTSWLCSIR